MGMTKSPAVEIPADHLEEVDDLQERNGKKRTSVDQEEGEGSCIVCRFVLGHPWRWFLVTFFSLSFHLIFLLNPHLWLHSRFIFDVLTPLYLHNCHGSGQLWVWTCWASAALARCSSQTQWRRVARTRYRACGAAIARFFLLLVLWLFRWTVVYNHGSVVLLLLFTTTAKTGDCFKNSCVRCVHGMLDGTHEAAWHPQSIPVAAFSKGTGNFKKHTLKDIPSHVLMAAWKF